MSAGLAAAAGAAGTAACMSAALAHSEKRAIERYIHI